MIGVQLDYTRITG